MNRLPNPTQTGHGVVPSAKAILGWLMEAALCRALTSCALQQGRQCTLARSAGSKLDRLSIRLPSPEPLSPFALSFSASQPASRPAVGADIPVLCNMHQGYCLQHCVSVLQDEEMKRAATTTTRTPTLPTVRESIASPSIPSPNAGIPHGPVIKCHARARRRAMVAGASSSWRAPGRLRASFHARQAGQPRLPLPSSI
ncbi:hypothetical protein GGTG_04377 [Gaeumannomyces tritici R3-111a-1]|uniref:Uncharacterized protein n=1 Tax=Gaeumannomyces tritici (strain R3-111a-1) TaxID=644352 RepID=J3NSX8_GAET3|nr:hypothetical protein GGTG_04377 [Gaeumannomyces tritici R3-111a-1]EJT79291.1 hypothetical protein GGTG_04377 [Gaeumannomyces tritici R3-111a-1]